MDPFSVQYAIKGMVRVSNIIFKKDRVRVHVAVGCIISYDDISCYIVTNK